MGQVLLFISASTRFFPLPSTTRSCQPRVRNPATRSAECAPQVWMNGAPLGDKFKRSSTYVAQEDVFVPTLSAWETLHFQAILRLPKGTSSADIKRRMDDVMDVMGLSRVKTTQVTYLVPFVDSSCMCMTFP